MFEIKWVDPKGIMRYTFLVTHDIRASFDRLDQKAYEAYSPTRENPMHLHVWISASLGWEDLMMHPLIRQVAHHQHLREKLAAEFPDADEETLIDTLEGMTNLHEMLAAVVRSRLDDLSLAAALRTRMADMQERFTRLEQRAEKKKEVVTSVMERAALKNLTEPDFTLSLRTITPPLVVVSEGQIPEAFWKPQPPKLDRQALLSALKGGREVPGVVLGNGGATISVRTK